MPNTGNRNTKRRRRREPEPPAKPPAEAMLPIRINQSLIDRVDQYRPDLIPREPYIRQLLKEKLDDMDEQNGEED